MTEDESSALTVAADTIALTRAEEIRLRYAAIVESSDDAIVAKTLEGVISAWNAAAERMFGYTEREAIGQPVTMIIPPDLHDEERDILRRLGTGERVDHFETVRVTKAGARIDVSLTISPLRDPTAGLSDAPRLPATSRRPSRLRPHCGTASNGWPAKWQAPKPSSRSARA